MAHTTVVIISSGDTTTLPGTSWTASKIQSIFADSVPGISGMQAESVTDEDGNVTMTFRMRTGTKG